MGQVDPAVSANETFRYGRGMGQSNDGRSTFKHIASLTYLAPLTKHFVTGEGMVKLKNGMPKQSKPWGYWQREGEGRQAKG